LALSPDEVLAALQAHQFERVWSEAAPDFRDAIPLEEIERVWLQVEQTVGAVQSSGPDLVLHDLALHCEQGDIHLQVAYQDGTLSGLVVLHGPPTGRFGR
jgi:hypothetical protein